jgi:hypothetical protein
MNGKQAKRARGYAHTKAERQGLWKKGEAGVYAKWWRKILVRLFPRLRNRYADWIGAWYKRMLKDWARQSYAWLHNGGREEAEYLARKRARVQRRFLAARRKNKTAVPLPGKAQA